MIMYTYTHVYTIIFPKYEHDVYIYIYIFFFTRNRTVFLCPCIVYVGIEHPEKLMPLSCLAVTVPIIPKPCTTWDAYELVQDVVHPQYHLVGLRFGNPLLLRAHFRGVYPNPRSIFAAR